MPLLTAAVVMCSLWAAARMLPVSASVLINSNCRKRNAAVSRSGELLMQVALWADDIQQAAGLKA